MRVEVTTYQPEYQQQIIDLILPIQREEFGSSITLDDQPDLLDIPTFYQQGHGNFWVALHTVDTNPDLPVRVIGTIAAIDMGNQQLALRKMFVAAAYRGKAIGVGRQLLETLCDWAVKREICEIYLGTIEAFKAAHRFYEKHGFQPITRADLPLTFPAMALDTMFYKLALSNCNSAGKGDRSPVV